jgi:hypothetical protein
VKLELYARSAIFYFFGVPESTPYFVFRLAKVFKGGDHVRYVIFFATCEIKFDITLD